MQVYFSKLDKSLQWPASAQPPPGLAIAVGNFDGVHLGHQHLLGILKQQAAQQGLEPAILTFEPHPKAYFDKSRLKNRLTILRAKLQLFESLGIKHSFIMRFNNKLAQTPPQDFLAHLQQLNCKLLVTGADFAFGKNRVGNKEYLAEKQREYGFKHIAVDKLAAQEGGEIISSSTIRALLRAGDVEKANQALGRQHFVVGKVAHGLGKGRELGFATANLYLNNQLSIKQGVYATEVILADKKYISVTNYGIKPTIGGKKLTLEAHLFNYSGEDLYGQIMQVRFKKFIRAEQKFSSLEELQKQVAKDIKIARAA